MTAQMGEKIFCEGKECVMISEPLSGYLSKNPHIQFVAASTACWRGYLGTWEVIEDKLYLIGLKGWADMMDKEKFSEEKRELRRKIKQGLMTSKENQKQLKELRERLTERKQVSVETLFPGQNRVFASWYDDVIRIPQGKLLNYVHMGYASTYEKELLLGFRAGLLVSQRTMENPCRSGSDQSSSVGAFLIFESKAGQINEVKNDL